MSVEMLLSLLATLFCCLSSSHGEPCVTKAEVSLSGGSGGLDGTITFSQPANSAEVSVTGDMTGLPSGKHGFHIHQFGRLTDSCRDAGGHYNPLGKKHGGPADKERHVGDLGNIASGTVDITDGVISLRGRNSIIGRSLVIHAGEDDLGKGGDPGSEATGNAGARLACGVLVVTEEQDSSTCKYPDDPCTSSGNSVMSWSHAALPTVLSVLCAVLQRYFHKGL